MIMKDYMMDKDGKILYNGMLVDDVAFELNRLITQVRRLEEQLGTTVQENTKLKTIIQEYEELEDLFDMNYWKGIEEAYDRIFKVYIDRLAQKDVELFALECENDYLKGDER